MKLTPKEKQRAIDNKIAHLVKEGKPSKQAVGEAYGMANEGRLTEKGDYIRGKKK